MTGRNSLPYDGFISYSHAADGRLAPALQRGLQRLAKPWNSRRALNIFRDETGLSTNPHLWGAIEGALDQSEWFVLFASPQAAQSEWVNKEITHWLATKAVDHILPVLTDGTWGWDAGTGDFTADSSAVPPALRGALTEEPRHLDLRWAHTETDLDLRNARFRSAVADLAAPMHHMAKDELEGEDVRQQRRTRRLARGAVGALSLLLVGMVVLSIVAVVQGNRARASATSAHNDLMINQSQQAIGTDPPLSQLLALQADELDPNSGSFGELLNAMLADPNLQRSFGPERSGAMATIADHRVVVLDRGNDGQGSATPNRNVVQVWNWQTGQRVAWSGAPLGDSTSGADAIASTGDGTAFAVLSRNGMIQRYSGRTLSPEGPPFPSGLGTFPAFHVVTMQLSSDASTIAVVDSFPTPGVDLQMEIKSITLLTRHGARWTPDPPLEAGAPYNGAVALSADGSEIAMAQLNAGTSSDSIVIGNPVVIDNTSTGQTSDTFTTRTPPGLEMAFDLSRHRVVVDESENYGTTTTADAVWYDLRAADPVPHPLDVGATGTDMAAVAYDQTGTRLGINSTSGLRLYDANSMAPVAGTSVLPTTSSAWLTFLEPDVVLTPADGPGPANEWNVGGPSPLVTTVASNGGVAPLYPTWGPDRTYATTGAGPGDLDLTITIRGPDNRPLGAPIVVSHASATEAAAAGYGSGSGREGILANPDLTPAVACGDAADGRFATVTVDPITNIVRRVVVHSGVPPFKVIGTSGPSIDHARLLYPRRCAWSPNGQQIALISQDESSANGGYRLTVVDAANGSLASSASINRGLSAQVRGPSNGASPLFFSADSSAVWIGERNGAFRVSHLGDHPTVQWEFPGAVSISTDADGQRLVVAYPTTVQVVDAQTLAPLTGRIPVSLTGNGTLGEVDSAPDGSLAVVNGTEGWRLVDLDTQQTVGPWVIDAPRSAAVFGPRGSTVINEDPPHPSAIWDIAPAVVRATACAMAGRNLTEAEWQAYLSWSGPRQATCPQYPLP